MSIKINYKDKTIEYEVWQHPECKAYFVDLTDESEIPIEIVKDALEEKFNIKIKSYRKTGHKSYEKDNYRDSNEFCYYFVPESD